MTAKTTNPFELEMLAISLYHSDRLNAPADMLPWTELLIAERAAYRGKADEHYEEARRYINVRDEPERTAALEACDAASLTSAA